MQIQRLFYVKNKGTIIRQTDRNEGMIRFLSQDYDNNTENNLYESTKIRSSALYLKRYSLDTLRNVENKEETKILKSAFLIG